MLLHDGAVLLPQEVVQRLLPAGFPLGEQIPTEIGVQLFPKAGGVLLCGQLFDGDFAHFDILLKILEGQMPWSLHSRFVFIKTTLLRVRFQGK